MVLTSTGPILFSNIQTEFGGTPPISLSEYCSDHASGYTSGVTGIPATGQSMRLSVFLGKSKQQPITNLNAKISFLISELQGGGLANGSDVSSLGGFITGGTKPKYYSAGGYRDRPYVNFLSATPATLKDTVGNRTYAINDGLTYVMLMKPTEDGSVNKNNFARFAATWFTNGGWIEIGRFGTSNNLFMIIYNGVSGQNTEIFTSNGTPLVTGSWGVYVFRYKNSTRFMDIKYRTLSSETSIASINDLTTAGSITGNTAYSYSAFTTNGSSAFATYINTSLAVPAMNFGGGYVFDRGLTDSEVVNAVNSLLNSSQ
jgi:hypothetical protein